ncbi:MAG TPA: outer membrane beta-barrel protein [Gemmatimonadaceae bacterium]|nr:outer membrane beta-barrel protein [Gemmatimonadaceae bacterium]
MIRFPFLAAVLAGALCLAARALHAQSGAALGVEVGATAPVSDYGNGRDLGYHLGVALDVRAPLTPIGFRADGMYHELKFTNRDAKTRIWAATADIVVHGGGAPALTPYLLGGAGIYNVRRPEFLGQSSVTNAGVNVGGGLRFGLTGFSAFIEARYHKVIDQDVRIVPITFGLLF